MAEHLVFPLNGKLHLHRNRVEEQFLVPKSLQIRIRRKYYSGSCKTVQFSSSNAKKLNSQLTNLKFSGLRKSFTKCCSLGALVDADNLTISEWVPIADQLLLMASVFLTYIAGVVPVGKPFTDARADDSSNTVPKNSNLSGRCSPEQNLHFAWDIIKAKLLDSLEAMKQGVPVLTGIQEEFASRPSSLLALAEFPRLRLLLASFQWLRKQVNDLAGNHTASDAELLMGFTSIIQNSCQPLCMAWLEDELSINNSRLDKVLLSSMINKLNGTDSVLQYIRKSGKEYLYSELIFTLGCGSRTSGFYDPSLFIQHGVAVLEDLLITLADGIASMYLELISVDSSISSEMNSLGLNLCSLSTRSLQRLRNEVALHQWLHQNMESVVSMYEDRFDLCTFERRVVEESSESAENFKWWKKLSIRRSMSLLPDLSFVVITPVSVSVKRTKELRALNGWRYYFSLFLELSDIAMPLVRTVIAKVSDAISFFLVSLIGRSLGLIYTGIRQSLRWK
ncbi:hypothetical protein M9H77_01216 [Catharanthus roseus]|uniref:Uncharacterized protein n=1 Tax=Catharanthus roseus TaxID=4058 RepID=A0ACC0C522_CATRO|nr:hypothetical protein M9H77_01216 [Catharanthus roseus]